MPELAELNMVIRSSQVAQADARLDHLDKTSTRVERQTDRTTQSLAKQDRTSQQLASTLGFLARTIGPLLGGMTALGVAISAVEKAAKFEQTQTAFTTLLGNAEQAVELLKELEEFAATTPFQFQGLADTTRLLLALGFRAEEAVDILKVLGDAAAAFGQGTAMVDRLALALGQMRAAGKVLGGEMRQLTEAGVSAKQFIADDLGVSVQEVTELIEKGALDVDRTINAILEGLKRSSGGAAKDLAQTTGGLFSTLKDNVDFTLRDVGQTLIEALDLRGKLQGSIDSVGTYGEFLSAVIKQLARFEDENTKVSATVIITAESVRLAANALIALTLVKTVPFFTTLILDLTKARIAFGQFQGIVLATALTLRASGPMAAGLTATRGGILLVAGALRSLFAAIGPAGWVIIGITAILEILPLVRRRANDTADAVEQISNSTQAIRDTADAMDDLSLRIDRAAQQGDFRGQINQLEAMKARLEDIRIELQKDPQSRTGRLDVEKLFAGFDDAALQEFFDLRMQTIREQFLAMGASIEVVNGLTPEFQLATFKNIELLDAVDIILKRLGVQIDETKEKAISFSRESGSALTVFGGNTAELEREIELLQLQAAGFTRRAEIEKELDRIKAEAAKNDEKLSDTELIMLQNRIAQILKLKDTIKEQTEAEREADRVRQQAIDSAASAEAAINNTIESARRELHMMKLSNDEREIAQGIYELENAAKRGGIEVTEEQVAALVALIKAQQDIRASTEAATEAEREATRTEQQRVQALQSLTDYIRELQFEESLIGKTSEVRERSIRLRQLESELIKLNVGDLKQIKAQLDTAPEFNIIDIEKAELVGVILDRVREKMERLKEEAEFEQYAQSIGDAFGGLATDVAYDFDNLEEHIKQTFLNISKLAFEQFVSRQLANFITSSITSNPGFFGGARAGGGPVYPGQAFLVGEEGPELFVPKHPGDIIPHDETMARITNNSRTDSRSQRVDYRVTINNYGPTDDGFGSSGRRAQRRAGRSTKDFF